MMARRIAAAFVPLVDCAVLVAARECGFAAEQGIALELLRQTSWASLRDHLNLGHVDCAHALAPLPIASTLGVGHVSVDCIVPFVLGRGGNAITVSTSLHEEMCDVLDEPLAQGPEEYGRALAQVARRRREPLTLGMVFPFSNHNFDLRYWLAASGLHPDRDVRIVSIPPPLMVESLRAGHIDACCVGEPWNSLAVEAGLGRIVVTKSQLFPGGIEKVLTLPAGAERDLETLGALLRALRAAALWADDVTNKQELAALLARPEYLDMSADIIARALLGRLDLGGGETLSDSDFLYFARDSANRPGRDEALFIYAQMVRWGHLAAGAAQEAAARRVYRPDLCDRLLDLPPAHSMLKPPFDGIELDADDLAGYIASFDVNTPYVAAGASAREH